MTGIRSEGENSQMPLIMCPNVGCKNVFKYRMEKNRDSLRKIITSLFSILT